jgi:hypothetical protein
VASFKINKNVSKSSKSAGDGCLGLQVLGNMTNFDAEAARLDLQKPASQNLK